MCSEKKLQYKNAHKTKELPDSGIFPAQQFCIIDLSVIISFDCDALSADIPVGITFYADIPRGCNIAVYVAAGCDIVSGIHIAVDVAVC